MGLHELPKLFAKVLFQRERRGGCVTNAPLLDGVAEMLHERRVVAQEARLREVHECPKISQGILNRGAGEQDTAVCPHLSQSSSQQGGNRPHYVGLVANDHVPGLLDAPRVALSDLGGIVVEWPFALPDRFSKHLGDRHLQDLAVLAFDDGVGRQEHSTARTHRSTQGPRAVHDGAVVDVHRAVGAPSADFLRPLVQQRDGHEHQNVRRTNAPCRLN
mmetsp:Transcript_120376/g.340614  ORF Transcript_120376/g.340614 Transcript_120376/m.340614 type:complete len:217 (-) Transcript_120376:1333-1983(-)